jgi:hypothetical protein
MIRTVSLVSIKMENKIINGLTRLRHREVRAGSQAVIKKKRLLKTNVSFRYRCPLLYVLSRVCSPASSIGVSNQKCSPLCCWGWHRIEPSQFRTARTGSIWFDELVHPNLVLTRSTFHKPSSNRFRVGFRQQGVQCELNPTIPDQDHRSLYAYSSDCHIDKSLESRSALLSMEVRVSNSDTTDATYFVVNPGRQLLDARNIPSAGALEKADQRPENGV